MTAPLINGGHFIMPPPLKDNNLSIISTYDVIKFDESKNDNACVYRIIEIYRLTQLIALSDLLFQYSGLSLPDAQIDADEINKLLSRCEALYRQEKEAESTRQRAVDVAKHKMNQVRENAQSLFEAKKRANERARNDERDYKNTLSLLDEQKKRTEWFMSLAGMLHSIDDKIKLVINMSLMRQFPATTRIPECFVRNDIHSGDTLFRAGASALTALGELERSAKHIIEKCTSPTDKYAIHNNGEFISNTYRHYYHPDNRILQAVISAEEYICYATELQKPQLSKVRIFN